jgi:1,2-diacylglycerol 3-beta-glucosyltransferase
MLDWHVSWGWLVTAWLAVYFVLMAVLISGMLRLKKSVRAEDAGAVTVLVTARNEVRDLPRCIESLLAIDYPLEQLQIILVDDLSDDGTGELIDAVAAAHSHIIALHSRDLSPNGLEAKARGIAHGFDRATGEWVLITDADAAVHPQWIRHLLGRVDARTGVVGGALVVEPEGIVGIIERVCWAFVQAFNLGMAGWGVPFVVLGPNMAVRRSVYERAGGLRAAKFRVAEDLALFGLVMEQGYAAQSYLDTQTSVLLRPVPSARHLFSQQRRWLGGGLSHGAAYTIFLLVAFWWGFGIALFVLAGWLLSPPLWLGFVLAKMTVEGVVFFIERRRLALSSQLRYLLVLEVYHVFVFFILPLSFLFSRRVRWMGDGYSVTYS